jgi:hypothetical protein
MVSNAEFDPLGHKNSGFPEQGYFLKIGAGHKKTGLGSGGRRGENYPSPWSSFISAYAD